MDKAKIKTFAVWARTKLMSDIKYKMNLLGITEKEIKNALPSSNKEAEFYEVGTKEPYMITGDEIKQRQKLVEKINTEAQKTDYLTAYQNVVEEVAYTWFNRIIAVRFMEVNDYIPSHIRVLSSTEKGKTEPDIVTRPFDTDLTFSESEIAKIGEYKLNNKTDELFKILFIKECNALYELLPNLFEKTNDYTELLISLSVVDRDGVIYRLINDIPESDFDVKDKGQVEIIGWLYQYYISEKHEEVVDPLHEKTVKKEDIPAATQLFTTDWVVKYIVDNSLGRYYIERNPNSTLKEKLSYLALPKDKKIDIVPQKIIPQDIKVFDPCMGSGHFLVYAFDVLMEIYRESGYTDRDAAKSIIENNLYGIDIDERASQMAYFAVMMKARKYNRRILTKETKFNTLFVIESTDIKKEQLNYFGKNFQNEERTKIIGQLKEILNLFENAKEFGSMLYVKKYDWQVLSEFVDDIDQTAQISIETIGIEETKEKLQKVLKIAELLAKKYQVVVTNPPYLNKYTNSLKAFVYENFKDYSSDLFSVFMYRNFDFCTNDGYSGFMTPNVWMFIKSYEKLRKYIIEKKSITTLVQMAKGAFFKEATVDVCGFVLKNEHKKTAGYYFRLEEFKGDMEVQNQKVLEAIQNPNCGYYYEALSDNFTKIPGSPIAYWVSERVLEMYKYNLLSEKVNCKSGIATGSDKYIQFWFEPLIKNIKFDCKSYKDMGNYTWFPVNSGGGYRKWYGNNQKIVNLWNNGFEIKKNVKNYSLRSQELYFKKGITWGRVTSSEVAFREVIDGSLFGDAGPIGFIDKNRHYALGFLCSNTVKYLLSIKNPTVNCQVHDIMELPLIFEGKYIEKVEKMVFENISISKTDWDAFETSWDFQKHPLI